MQITYIEPFSRAFARMKGLLFAPFVARTWFVMGFAAWLANVFENNPSLSGSGGSADDDSAGEWGGRAAESLETILALGLLATILLASLVAVVIILLWVSSRAKFVFLDNVIRGEARVSAPWNEYGARANSLFVWRLVFGVIVLLVCGLFTLPMLLGTGVFGGAGLGDVSWIVIVLYGLAMVGAVVIPALYIGLFLDSFIVPLMYAKNLTATQAWGRFWPLLRDHPGHFILYGIVMFVLNVVVGGALVIVGVMTCCFGLVLLALPYIGTVVTLPVWVTFRAYSVEYLRQFDPELPPFARAGPPPVPPPVRQPPRETT